MVTPPKELACFMTGLCHVTQDKCLHVSRVPERTTDDDSEYIRECAHDGRVFRGWEVLQHAQALDLQPGAGDAVVCVVRAHVSGAQLLQDPHHL